MTSVCAEGCRRRATESAQDQETHSLLFIQEVVTTKLTADRFRARWRTGTAVYAQINMCGQSIMRNSSRLVLWSLVRESHPCCCPHSCTQRFEVWWRVTRPSAGLLWVLQSSTFSTEQGLNLHSDWFRTCFLLWSYTNRYIILNYSYCSALPINYFTKKNINPQI